MQFDDWRTWTRGDWGAVPVILLHDARHWLARWLLDGPLGRAIESEVGYRQMLAHATAMGSDCFCVYHDCDTKDCPPGAHEDD